MGKSLKHWDFSVLKLTKYNWCFVISAIVHAQPNQHCEDGGDDHTPKRKKGGWRDQTKAKNEISLWWLSSFFLFWEILPPAQCDKRQIFIWSTFGHHLDRHVWRCNFWGFSYFFLSARYFFDGELTLTTFDLKLHQSTLCKVVVMERKIVQLASLEYLDDPLLFLNVLSQSGIFSMN